MGNDQQIILFPFELEDDGFETDCKVVVGLVVVNFVRRLTEQEIIPQLADTDDDMDLLHAL